MKVGNLWFVQLNFTIFQLDCYNKVISDDYVGDAFVFVVIHSRELPLGSTFKYILFR